MNGTTFPNPAYDTQGGQNYGPPDNQYQNYSNQQNQNTGNYNQGGYQQGNSNQGGYQQNNNGGYSKPWQNNRQNGGGGGFKRKPDDDLTLYKPYACTGNQNCPPEIMEKFVRIAKKLEELGYTARVGGMDGIEDTVEKAINKKEVHLPFKDFNQKQSKFTYNSERAFAVAKMFHPTFDSMKKGVQCFLAKNARLLLGDRMNSPALFLVCWSEDGVESGKMKTNQTGFAGHPIAIAGALGIPIFNLARPDTEDRINFIIESAR